MENLLVFISYRREYNRDFAGRVYSSLVNKGAFKGVYLDVNNYREGRWEDNVFEKIQKADYFLMIVTENSLNECINKNDIVRREFEMAKRYNRKIIPITDDLNKINFYESRAPRSMKQLFQLQFVELRHNCFEPGINRLMDFMRVGEMPVVNKTSKDLKSFLSVLFPFMVLVAFSVTVLKGQSGNWQYSILIPITLFCQGFWAMLSSSQEIRWMIFMAFGAIIIGTSILSGRLTARKGLDGSLSMLGYVLVSAGLGMGAVLAIFKSRKYENYD